MCGIFGEFGFRVSHKSYFRKILSLSRSRGPDMEGYFSNRSIQFGFNRLSVLDTSVNGNQPMFSPSGRYLVICNGEIVNYKNLIRVSGLKKKALRSGSDVEVITHLFDLWGLSKTINSVRGMYALAVYDFKIKKLKLIRDPAGIKPLYCARTSEGWLFASQYDQIFKHQWFAKVREINPDALSEYLQLGYIPSPNALFKNSWLINPGEFYEIDKNLNYKKGEFYKIMEDDLIDELNPLTAEKLDNKLQSVLPDYINSDVPLGTFLSGGIDSPLITAILSKHNLDLKAYTVSSKHSGIDESVEAKNISNFLKISHHIEPFRTEYITQWIDSHFSAFSEPFSDYSSLPTFILCGLASQNYKVMLGGDGGDENFWGYPRFLSTMDYRHWFKFPVALRRSYAWMMRRITDKRISSGIEIKSIGDWVFERQGPHFSKTVRKFIPDLNYTRSTGILYESPPPGCDPEVLLRWLRRNEFYGHMQRRLLKVDRASMAHGLEVRLPFLDQEVINFMNGVIPSLGVKHRVPKILLKTCLWKHLPKNLVLNQKQGFSINLNNLLRNELKQNVQGTLIDSKSIFDNHIDKGAVSNQTQNYMSNEHHNGWSIWTLFSLYKFADLHLDK